MLRFITTIPLALTLLVFVNACGSSSSNQRFGDDCIKPNMRSVIIRWGTWVDSSTVLDGYEIDAQRRLFKYKASEYSVKYLRDSIGVVPAGVFCFYADTIRKTFVRIQSLSVHAPRMHYIEYQNPDANLSLRAVWDARYQTYGSREFRAIFDSLSTLAPPAQQ